MQSPPSSDAPTGRVALFSTNSLEYSQTFVYDEVRAHDRYAVEVFSAQRLNRDRFPYEPVHLPSEVESDPHLASRGLFFRLETPRGEIPQVRTPVTPKDTAFTPPPRAGEHTRAILREGGLGDAEIDALLKDGVARE